MGNVVSPSSPSALAPLTLAVIATLAFSPLSCSDDAAPDLGVAVYLYGPPTGEFPGLDPFQNCEFVKICHLLPGETTLRFCTLTTYDERATEFSGLPVGVELAIVAECYAGSGGPDSEPIEPVVSRGQSVPFVFDGATMQQITVYMLPISTFGPSCSPPVPEAPPGTPGLVENPTFPRWGGSLTELPDKAVLIAGGVEVFKSGCADWSDPKCVQESTATAELYDPRHYTFATLAATGNSQMSVGRSFAASVALPSGSAAILGGLTNNGEPTNSVDIFDPFSGTFSAGPPMQETRAHHTASVISSHDEGYVLVVGGYGAGEATWEVWTPKDGSVASGQLQESRFHHTATLITKNIDSSARQMVVVAGGEGGGPPGATTVRSTMEIFDIDNQQFDSVLYPLCANTGPGTPKTMHAAAFVPKRHFIYVMGGFSDAKHQSPTKDICVNNTKHEEWSGEAGTFLLDNPPGALRAFALPGNVVLHACGMTKIDGELQADPTQGMLYPRWDCSGIPTADGKILFVGGLTGPPAQPEMVLQAEVFNPH